MKDLELLKNIGSQISGKVICPDCLEVEKLDQELFTIGDHENLLFCPHCDLGLELKLTYRS